MAQQSVGTVMLKNVRLSFAALFEPDEQENDDGTIRRTFKANFLIPKEGTEGYDEFAKANLAKISKAAAEAKAKKWGSDKSNWPKLRPDKLCLRDGDLEDWDGYADHHYLSSNSPEKRKPSTVTNRKDSNNRWITAEEGEKGCPYSGCYVNALIRIWVQDNKHGKRINASLESVQFRADGEAFGAAPVDPNDIYDDDDVSEEGNWEEDDSGDDDGLI